MQQPIKVNPYNPITEPASHKWFEDKQSAQPTKKEVKAEEEKKLPPLIQHLADAIEAKGMKVTFGLQPDDIELIEKTIQEGFTTEYAFEKVAKQINWDKYTLACWYIKHISSQTASLRNENERLRKALEEIAILEDGDLQILIAKQIAKQALIQPK